MRYRSPAGHFYFYDPELSLEEQDAEEENYPTFYARGFGRSEREHELVLEQLERTKIVRVYDGNGKLVSEVVDTSIQHLIDRENAAYEKDLERRKKEAAREKQKKIFNHDSYIKNLARAYGKKYADQFEINS